MVSSVGNGNGNFSIWKFVKLSRLWVFEVLTFFNQKMIEICLFNRMDCFRQQSTRSIFFIKISKVYFLTCLSFRVFNVLQNEKYFPCSNYLKSQFLWFPCQFLNSSILLQSKIVFVKFSQFRIRRDKNIFVRAIWA